MIFCLDTDILIEYFRGNEKIQSRIRSLNKTDSIGVTWLSYYEFFKGIYAAANWRKRSSSRPFSKRLWFLIHPTNHPK